MGGALKLFLIRRQQIFLLYGPSSNYVVCRYVVYSGNRRRKTGDGIGAIAHRV